MELVDITGQMTEMQNTMQEVGADVLLLLGREPAVSMPAPLNSGLKYIVKIKANDTYYVFCKIGDNKKLQVGAIIRVKGQEGQDLTKAMYDAAEHHVGTILDDLVGQYLAPKDWAKGSIYFVADSHAFGELEKITEAVA